MPNPPLKKNSSAFAGKKLNSYLAWYLSSLGVVVILAGALTYLAGTMYLSSEKLVTSSNKKIVETAGIEITVELKKKDLDIAKQIVARKSTPFELPLRLRDIFQFDSYAGETPNIKSASSTPPTNPPS
jgi:hypothetical protein